MIGPWLAIGCGPAATEGDVARPDHLPADAIQVVLDASSLKIADKPVAERSALTLAPTDGEDQVAVEALALVRGLPAWLTMPPSTPFWLVRKLIVSARAAGATAVYLGDPAVPIAEAPRFALGGCAGAPIVATGAIPLITVSIQADTDRAWVAGTATFLPVIGAAGATDGIADCVVAAPCTEAFADPVAQATCAAAPGDDPERIWLGSGATCLLGAEVPFAEVPRWRADVAGAARALGLAAQPLVVVLPEARVRTDALVAVLEGLVDGGLARPAVGTAALVEGNDGAPTCPAPVADRPSLEQATARWYGSLSDRRP